MKFIVMRRACLMEDEGREHLLRVCDSRTEAQDYINTYTDYNKGYFKHSDLYIAEEFDAKA